MTHRPAFAGSHGRTVVIALPPAHFIVGLGYLAFTSRREQVVGHRTGPELS
jgi:hypothetical protein